jgi:hypothetical protein
MRLTIHRRDFGVDPDGQWHQRIDGEWVEIQRPEWSKKKEQPKVVDLKMKPPEGYTNKMKRKIPTVEVFRIIKKTVPDYEAEVLCRNGWQRSETLSQMFEQLTLEDALENSP